MRRDLMAAVAGVDNGVAEGAGEDVGRGLDGFMTQRSECGVMRTGRSRAARRSGEESDRRRGKGGGT